MKSTRKGSYVDEEHKEANEGRGRAGGGRREDEDEEEPEKRGVVVEGEETERGTD